MPIKPRQTDFSHKISAIGELEDCVVGPGGVPSHRDFNDLACPTGANAGFDSKRQFPKLSNVGGGHPLPFAARETSCRDELKTDPIEDNHTAGPGSAAMISAIEFLIGKTIRQDFAPLLAKHSAGERQAIEQHLRRRRRQ